MKILMTGMLSRQCMTREDFLATGHNDYLSIPTMMKAALESLGHEVTTSAVEVGEQLKGSFDLAVVGVHGLGGIAAIRHRFGALWTCTQLPHVLYAQDWNLADTCRQLFSNEVVWGMTGGNHSKRAEEFERAFSCDEIHKLLAGWRVMVPSLLLFLHRWGDSSRFHELHGRRIKAHARWDPSPWAIKLGGPHGWSSMAGRRKAWSVVSLADMTKQEKVFEQLKGLTWPMVGRWSSDQPYVPEREVYRHARELTGMIMTRHRHLCKLPGWWRHRWTFGPMRGCIMAADPEDVTPALRPFVSTPQEVERLSDEELDRTAHEQHDAFRCVEHPLDSAVDLEAQLLACKTEPEVVMR